MKPTAVEKAYFTLLNQTTELKPCPFCGTIPQIKIHPLPHYKGCYTADISCQKCGCHITLHNNDTINRTLTQAVQSAVNTWNTRKETE